MTQRDQLTISKPDDWHVHFRDGDILKTVVPFTARQFSRAVVMPNLMPPITNVESAKAYRDRIIASVPSQYKFNPLMTCFMTNNTKIEEIKRGFMDGVFLGVKLYPMGATTNSELGVTNITRVYDVLGKMSLIGIPLLVHGEVTDPDIDIFDREAVFIERILIPLIREFPELKIVIEHLTTEEGVSFVQSEGEYVAGTITAHHLIINRSDIFKNGIRPHLYCLPIAKRERHRLALRKAATSGDQSFFLGTDTAPHSRILKESACGCAGIFSAPFALETYTQIFDEENALDKLEAFASINGAKYYGLPINKEKITLKHKASFVPNSIKCSNEETLIPFLSGKRLNWKFIE